MSNWYEQAETRLKDEFKTVTGRYEVAMSSAVRDTLLEFCRQNEEFAQAVAQGGSFKDCMTAVAKGVVGFISDLEAYRRAAAFYFDGAQVSFAMSIQLEPQQTGILLDLSNFF